MPEHPMVLAIVQGCTDPGTHLRARADAAAVEELVAEARALTTATEASRARLTAIVQQVDRFIGPWRTNHPTAELVAWHESIRGSLHAQAVKLVGHATAHLIAPAPTERLDPGPAGLLGRINRARRAATPSRWGLW